MKLTVKHIGYLAVIILMVSLTLVGVSINYIKSDQHSNRVINTAGKQRMLSQRIFKDIYKLAQSTTDRQEILADLEQSYSELIKAHNGLRFGDSELSLPASTSSAVFQQYDVVSKMLTPLQNNLEELFAAKGKVGNLDTLLSIARTYEDTLLEELNESVTIYEAEANAAAASLDRVYIAAGIFYLVVLLTCFTCGLILVGRMKKGVVQIKEQSAGLQDAGASLSESSEDLSASSVEQESAVTETLAALAQINAVITKNCDSAQVCLSKIENVKNMSSEGNQAILNLTNALNTVNSSVHELEEFNNILRDIETKTQVIDDIVLKTQLLSVNASIEAERAGEYGVGFSVVAEEVGKLAITSGNEAKDIRRLINDSFSSVKELVENSRRTTDQGLRSCEQSKELYQSIDAEFSIVNDQMREITDASMQQDASIGEVTSSMSSMKESIHINSKAASKYQDMASNFTGDARKLGEVAGVFSAIMGLPSNVVHNEKQSVIEYESHDLDRMSVESLINKANNLQSAKNDSQLFDASDVSFKRKQA